MSEMTYLEKLLDGAEVERVALGEVIDLQKGKQLDRHLLSDEGLYPAYNGGVSFSGFTDIYNYDKNTIIVSQGGASAGFVNFVASKFYANAHCFVVLPRTEVVMKRYVYHFLKLNQEQLTNNQHGAGIPALRKSELLDLKIPIPCPSNPEKSLAIQAEIVRILDTFTLLTAELTTELTARKKQNNYYRDYLLTFEDGEVEWVPLGEFATITIGEFIHKNKQDPSADFPVYNGGTTPTGYFDRYNNTGDKIIVSARGANAGFINKISKPYWAGNSCYSIGINDPGKLNWSFVYYFLKHSEHKLIGDQQKGGIPAVSKRQMEVFQVPIPYASNRKRSLAEQARIVSILDKLDMLTHSIREGLPGEIELRQKQYEYYRDMLFNFPTPESHTETSF